MYTFRLFLAGVFLICCIGATILKIRDRKEFDDIIWPPLAAIWCINFIMELVKN